MEMTLDERIAYEWAIKQEFQSVAARYARVLAKYIERSCLTLEADDPNAECPICGQPTGWINVMRRLINVNGEDR